MNKFQLYRLLRKNTNLSYKRSPAFEQNKWAKVLIYMGGGLFVTYLILYGGIIAMTADGEAGRMLSFMPVILFIDFMLRFIFQTTPGMMVKPYILQPISRYTAIECFLLSSHVSGYNFLWLAMFIPYSMIILIAGAGFWAVLLELIASELLIMINSQVYLFFRTLINRRVLWFIPALAFYAIPYTPLLINHKPSAIGRLIDTYAAIGTGWYFVPALILIILALFYMNRAFQFKYVYEEISKSKERELKHVSQFRFLESPMYDNELMQNFWCVYCFAIYGVTALIKIMGQEGNYIDLLMTHKENIIALLEAKFWFYSMVLIIPFLIMLPAVFTGKFTLLMLCAYMLLTAGFLHFIIFQLAVYNKQTLPLQQKVTAKGNFENGMQIVIEMAALFGPILITGVGYLLVGLTYTYIFICVFGMAFIVAHPLWIRNIYNRMMKRRYENLEGFHSTRQ